MFFKFKKPIAVHLESHPDGKIPVGQAGLFRVVNIPSARVQTKAYISYDNITYLKPLGDWSSQDTIHFFPEAPGSYVLSVEWKEGEKQGWITQRFTVQVVPQSVPSPTIADLKNGIKLWTPSSWEAGLIQRHEVEVIDYLQNLIKPNWTVYDIGANLGLFSIFFSKLVKKSGIVYCIEANPLCVYFLRANLNLNGISNAVILPVALGGEVSSVDFTINYGNSNLGISSQSGLAPTKIGHNISVESINLDTLIEAHALQTPNFIKIDIEGAEEYVVPAMTRTLAKNHPTLLIELHGEKASRNTLLFLKQFDYQYTNLGSMKKYPSADELIADIKDEVIQVVAIPRKK